MARMINIKGKSISENTIVEALKKHINFEPIVHKQGNRYKENRYNEKYILAHVNPSELCLVSLKNGHYWHYPEKVKDVWKLTEKEWNRIKATGDFTLIS